MKTLKRISALLLALLLAASFSITAFAAESVTEPVTANDGEEKVVGDVIVVCDDSTHYYEAVSVNASTSSGKASVTADAVDVNSNSDGLIQVLDVEARGENSIASAHVNKNVTVTNNNANGTVEVIDVYANAANSTASVQVDGFVTVDKGGQGIIASTGVNGGTANVSVTGSVTAGGTGIGAIGTAGKVSVSAGSVTAGDGYAIYATNGGGGETLVNITGAATSQNGTGIHAETINNASKTTVTAGSVTAGGTGIEAVAEYGTSTVTVGTGTGESFSAGNVTAGGTGISAVSKTGGTTNITAGDVTASGYHGIFAQAHDTDSSGKVPTVTVEAGNITTNNNNGIGVLAEAGVFTGEANHPGNVTVKVGDIESTKYGLVVFAMGGAADVTADNISGSEGIYANTDKDSKSEITITVGTADKGGIVTGGIELDNGVTADNTQITVWKVDSISGSACEEAINYIVRIAEDSKKAIETGNSENLPTVKLGGTVTVQPKKGYKVTGVSNNGTPLQQQSDGSFSFDFVKNASDSYYGGILLSAIFEKLPDPKPSSPAVVATYKLKFDLDGGVLDGETELEMKCSAGQRIKLPEAPTKEGFVFAGWQTEVRGKKVVFEAGEKYTVSASKTFVALWVEE